jgi:hypothetical protein
MLKVYRYPCVLEFSYPSKLPNRCEFPRNNAIAGLKVRITLLGDR